MPRLSITLTDIQNTALERIAAETGATKQSMIGLAVSQWLESHDRAQPSGWYGWAEVAEPDPISGRPYTYSIGHNGPFASREEAAAYATRLATETEGDAISGVEVRAVAHVEHIGHNRP